MRDEVEASSSAVKLPEMSDLWRETLGWQPDAIQQEQFQRFYELILTANQQFNLTRITESSEFWEKHLWDSLLGIAQFLPTPHSTAFKAIDIGTGAGFPGVPIAIIRPDWQLTLLDSTRKKITFVQESVQTLGLENVNFLVDRVEQAGQSRQHREQYDLALIRAVASAPVCAEYTLPLLKIGGLAVLYRGQWTEEEAENLAIAVDQLGGAIESAEKFLTPLTQSVRHCLYLRKIAPTLVIFPRATGIPTQTPLGMPLE
jgi:16S rRNA (guanine527-N7)-methyltransferase